MRFKHGAATGREFRCGSGVGSWLCRRDSRSILGWVADASKDISIISPSPSHGAPVRNRGSPAIIMSEARGANRPPSFAKGDSSASSELAGVSGFEETVESRRRVPCSTPHRRESGDHRASPAACKACACVPMEDMAIGADGRELRIVLRARHELVGTTMVVPGNARHWVRAGRRPARDGRMPPGEGLRQEL